SCLCGSTATPGCRTARSEKEPRLPVTMSAPNRRGFLSIASGAMAAAAATCGGSIQNRRAATALVPSGDGLATPAQLDAFIYLSSILTGYSPLDSSLAQQYMGSLRAQPGFLRGMRTLYQLAGMGSAQPPQTVQDLND